ncbi:uncharacterized protein CBL_06531 [Carabus blaptoides fortunei]
MATKMQEVIRDGALRLMTSEAMCDVILNCQGHRLMAHKVMLSIASPLLQELLLADQSETSLLVLPDINASTMAYILDYIYTGSVLLHSTVLSEFLSAANLLKLKIEPDLPPPNSVEVLTKQQQGEIRQNFPTKYYSKYSPNYEPHPEVIYPKNMMNCEYKNTVTECGPECYKLATVYSDCNTFKTPANSVDDKMCDYKLNEKRLKFSPIILQDERNPGLINGNRQYNEEKLKINSAVSAFKTSEIQHFHQPSAITNLEVIGTKRKTMRKVPNLMPITRCQFSAFKARKGLYNRVFPSPWSPRIVPVTVDPRNECLRTSHFTPTVPNGTFTNPTNVENSKENIEFFEDQNDKNNNFKTHPYTALAPVLSPTEKSVPPFRNADVTPLNLNVAYKDNNCVSYDRNYENTSQHREKVNSQPVKPYEITNNNLIPYEHKTTINDVKDSTFDTNGLNTTSDYQNVSASRVSESTYSSAESNLSCGDAKSCEEYIKVDKSDEDNGKEDGEVSSDQKQKPYKCEDCGKQFSQLRNYKYHRSVHEGTKEFAARCPECGKVFNDRGYLSSHLKIHRDRKEYGCPHCPKRFNQRVAYNMHLRIHTGVKPHVCPTCSKGFSRKMLLKQHQRVHTGERPYQCPECGKSFADRSNMSLHARLHTGVKPYGCNLCPKSFTKKHHLKTHMNYHTGLKPYGCQKCGLTFSQSSNMRTHYKKCIQKDTPDANNPVPVN